MDYQPLLQYRPATFEEILEFYFPAVKTKAGKEQVKTDIYGAILSHSQHLHHMWNETFFYHFL